jgi:ribonuclease G
MRARVDEVLVESSGDRLRAAVIAGGRLVDLLAEPRDRAGRPGNVHLGRVVRVMENLGAAFLDIGLADTVLLDRGKARLAEGQTLLVQIVEPPAGTKGARVSQRIALSGRGVMLLPGARGITASRRLPRDIAQRLVELAAGLKQADEGLILRTAAADAAGEAIAAEIAALRATWSDIAARAERATAPGCLHAEDALVVLLRDVAGLAPRRIVFDDRGCLRAARGHAGRLYPELADRLEFADDPLFDRYDVADALAASAEPRVPLMSGGMITVETTAALTAIDVDVGAGPGPLATNLEAAPEIARQLRLRDVGGLIVVDFVRMGARDESERVLAALRRAVANDRVKLQVLGWTAAGLVELIRPRARGAGVID